MEEEIHFGKVGGEIPDWRKVTLDDEDDDNDEDYPVSEGVLAVLGFDPDEEDEN